MSIDRRTFLVGAGGLLSISLVARLERHLEKTGRPLLLTPKKAEETLYVVGWNDYCICLGEVVEDLPAITWAEYLKKHGYDLTTPSGLQQAQDDWGELPDLKSEAPWFDWADLWARTEAPEAKAFRLLQDLGIGPELQGRDGECGEVIFYDGPFPGSFYLGAHCADELSVSLLQARLNELEVPIKVALV